MQHDSRVHFRLAAAVSFVASLDTACCSKPLEGTQIKHKTKALLYPIAGHLVCSFFNEFIT